MNKKWFFKNVYWGDEWQEYKEQARYHDQVAEHVADSHYHEDPNDPNDFDFDISVREDEDGVVKRFSVTASVNIDFNASEVLDGA